MRFGRSSCRAEKQHVAIHEERAGVAVRQVAVVLPVHDYGCYLAQALDALAEQTLRPDEVLVLDDGSTDDTLLVARRWQEANPGRLPLTVVHREHRGFASALNEAIRLTSAGYVVHVDADDTTHPRYLQALADALDETPSAGYAYPKMRLTGNENGIYLTHSFNPARLLFEGNYIPNVGMFRRQAFEATGGYRDLPTHVDWDLWLSFARTGWKAVLVDEVLYDWYRHPGTLTLRPPAERLAVRRAVLRRHWALVLRYLPYAPYWTFRAVWRRASPRFGFLAGRGPRLSASGWVES